MPETEEMQAEVMAAWGAWYGKMGENVVDGGNPFNMAKTIASDGTISDEGIATGYTVISAESLQSAVSACTDHPHLKYGGQVTVHQTFQM